MLRWGTSLRASLEAANDKAQAQTLNRANEKTLALTTGLSLHSENTQRPSECVSSARGSHFRVLQVGSWNTGSYVIDESMAGPEEPVRLLRFWPDQYLKLQQYF